jgi:hypothetical protein
MFLIIIASCLDGTVAIPRRSDAAVIPSEGQFLYIDAIGSKKPVRHKAARACASSIGREGNFIVGADVSQPVRVEASPEEAESLLLFRGDEQTAC